MTTARPAAVRAQRANEGLDLEPVDAGFRVRLRYGKGLRSRFLIRTTDKAAALRRALQLRDLAELLAQSGNAVRSKLIMKDAEQATNERDFAHAVKIAEEMCKASNRVQRRTGSAPVTFRQLGEMWTKGELHTKWPDHVKVKRSAGDDKGRLEWLYARIGKIPLSSFTLEDAERAMAELPTDRASATRRQYAQLISKVLKLAVYPCKYIESSPLPVGFLPRVTGRKATAFLYPSEDAQLLACTAVPLARRVLYGFLAREGLRMGEAVALTWRDFDLERGVVRLDVNKTDDPRAWALSPGVAAALKAFRRRDARDDALVFASDERRAAQTFRDDLKRAKVERSELFDDSAARKQIRVHDLRATFVTLSLAKGKTEAWVADRTGHKSSVMINRYRRQARQAAELDLGGLAPLVEALPEYGVTTPSSPQGGPEGGPELLAENSSQAPSIENPADFAGVPKVGLEPTRSFEQRILSPSRLPIPPLRLVVGLHVVNSRGRV